MADIGATSIPPSPGPLAEGATEQLACCPVCEGNRVTFHLWGRSRYNGKWFRYDRCPDCSAVFVNPRVPPSLDEGKVEQRATVDWKFRLAMPIHLAEFHMNIVAPAMKLLAPHDREGRQRTWLDVGCAIGTLPEAARRAGYAATGLELNRAMVDWATEHRPHLGIRQGVFSDLGEGERFDIISADNVLEHIHHPRAFIKEAKERLAPGGLLIIRVPNWNCFARHAFQATGKLSRSYIVDPDAHPLNYSRPSLESLLRHSGLRPRRTMEHLMVSYPLRHMLSTKLHKCPRPLQRIVEGGFPALIAADRIVPRGGIDITVFATPHE